jgi:hypothetical protein
MCIVCTVNYSSGMYSIPSRGGVPVKIGIVFVACVDSMQMRHSKSR